MNDIESMLEGINWIACIVILAVCIWAALDKRVHTSFIGTLVLAFVAAFAGLNIATPNALGLLPIHYQVALNVSLAAAGTWFFFHWRTKHIAERRRRKTDA